VLCIFVSAGTNLPYCLFISWRTPFGLVSFQPTIKTGFVIPHEVTVGQDRSGLEPDDLLMDKATDGFDSLLHQHLTGVSMPDVPGRVFVKYTLRRTEEGDKELLPVFNLDFSI
jgi:hypothetical protein